MTYFQGHNGQCCWTHQALNIEDALCEDLFWRMCQSDPEVLTKVVKAYFPDVRIENHEIVLPQGIRISLLPESCGVYCPSGIQSSYPHGSLFSSQYSANTKGHFIADLLQQAKGWLSENVWSNAASCLEHKLSVSQRYIFTNKPCSRRMHISDSDKSAIIDALNNSVPFRYGYAVHSIYWYTTESSTFTDYCVAYFKNETGKIVKLPVTKWNNLINTHVITFDTIHPEKLFAIYDLHEIARRRKHDGMIAAIICPNEETVEHIKDKHRWLLLNNVVTTYSEIYDSDWNVLKPLKPVIFPDATSDGCNTAYNLEKTLQKQGMAAYFVRRTKEHNCLDKDLLQLGTNGAVTLEDFARHCEQEFTIMPPAGIFPAAISLMSLDESETPSEVILDGLLNFGDILMLFAWRGIGKSMLGLLFALCFSTGTKALNGRICPSRKFQVLIIDGELPGSRQKSRAKAICRGLSLEHNTIAGVQVRSSIHEKKQLVLDTEVGWKELEPDMEQAEIIIVDSVFKVFPSTMGSDFACTASLIKFCAWCRERGKTAILIDHQGKKGDTAFGSMGKDIGLDAVLHLKKTARHCHAEITKNRNFPMDSPSWFKFQIKSAEKGEILTFCPVESSAATPALQALPPSTEEAAAVACVAACAPHPEATVCLDDAIIDFIKENKDAKQKEVVTAIIGKGLGKHSKIHARIKELRKKGVLTFWAGAPEPCFNSIATGTPST